MNLTSIKKAIKTLSIFGVMMALAGLLISNSPSASATSIGPSPSYGKVSAAPIFDSASSTVLNASIDVRNSNGAVVAKGSASYGNSYTTTLPVGNYKVIATAPGFKSFSAAITVTKGATTMVKATLTSVTDPPSTITRAAPAPAPSVEPAPVPAQLGKLNVSVSFPPNADAQPTVGVLVFDSIGNVVAKGEATNYSNFATQIAPGSYKVYIVASGYADYGEKIKVAANQTTVVKALLTTP